MGHDFLGDDHVMFRVARGLRTLKVQGLRLTVYKVNTRTCDLSCQILISVFESVSMRAFLIWLANDWLVLTSRRKIGRAMLCWHCPFRLTLMLAFGYFLDCLGAECV